MFQRELDRIIEQIEAEGKKPSLLLHVCCAPCSSYVIEYLHQYFDITLFFFNPNIATKEEHDKRLAELRRLVDEMPEAAGMPVVSAGYDHNRFLFIAQGLEDEPEGGERCTRCFEMRLIISALFAAEHKFDYFTTTLSISPHKDASRLNSIGKEAGERFGVPFLPSDFKKRDGFLRSIELSRQYNLYRQDYCGCEFSKNKSSKEPDDTQQEGAENVAQLWGGRFEKPTDQSVFEFNESLSFDRRMIFNDIEGSIAHVTMLAETGVLEQSDADQIREGLEAIEKEIADGTLIPEGPYEDVHSFVEAKLTDRIGKAGKMLHTGRSRNDQVALDMRLYTRDDIDQLDDELSALLVQLLELIKAHKETVMPGFTHMQKAQPLTLAHHLSAYFEMFRRDLDRISSIRERMNLCPLGAGALAGTTYPLDRELSAKLLDFDGVMTNSMDAVSDRDYLIEYLDALAIVMMHLSRFCEEIIIWNSDEYRFIEIDDAYSTGSSIMPQKKNPDVAELIRGKSGRVYGALTGLLVTMKSLPLAYNKDMQEDKEGAFMAMDTVHECVTLFTGMIATIRFSKDRMRASADGGFTNATDLADYLVRKGIPFRDAHRIVGELVLTCIEKGIGLSDLPIDQYRQASDLIGEDVYQAIDLDTCVNERKTIGAPGSEAMEEAINSYEKYIKGR